MSFWIDIILIMEVKMNNQVFLIQGGNKLSGTVNASGSKNASFPILAASILANGAFNLKRVPQISDIKITLDIIKKLGGKINYDFDKDNTVEMDIPNSIEAIVPTELGGKIRGSLYFLGALLAKNG